MNLRIKGSREVSVFGRTLMGFTVVAVLLSSSLGVKAAAPTAGSASGLSISPLRQDLTLKPGQADKIDITLKNITGGAVTAKVAVRDFQSDNLTGNPKIITDPNVKSASSIRDFLVGVGNVSLAVNEKKSFSIPVQAPDNASPGAYFGLVTYQAIPAGTDTTKGNNKVALSAAVGQLVLITVPGNITERMQLNAMHIYRDARGSKEGLIFSAVPKAAGIELSNLGNGFATPFGNITLQNSSGKTIYSYELNGGITRSIVLPKSARTFINPLKNITRPGRYTLVANVSYGSGSAIITGKKTFWVIPLWLQITIGVILLLLVIAALLIYRRYKKSAERRYRNK